jgi:hypothetical protein
MRVDNQTTRNARKRGEITQEQARKLLEAAEAYLGERFSSTSFRGAHWSTCIAKKWDYDTDTPKFLGQCDCNPGKLDAIIREIKGE